MKDFFQLRKDITNFGHLSDIELQRVAARATQLGVEMKDLAGVFNKFGTFEDAANSAALLSQTFGMNVDANRVPSTERGFDEKTTCSRHGVNHGTTSKWTSCEIDGKPSQHRVEADGFEERTFARSTLAVGKGRLPVAFHPAASQ